MGRTIEVEGPREQAAVAVARRIRVIKEASTPLQHPQASRTGCGAQMQQPRSPRGRGRERVASGSRRQQSCVLLWSN
jgi:hypothetical protein